VYLEDIKSQVKIKNEGKSNLIINQIKYVHTRYRYEIEIPNELIKGNKKPEDLVLTSQKLDFQRFHTEKIKDLLDKLES
jgi:DNA mismatch repair protein MSH6